MGARRSPTERGATLVEYALVVALLVVGAIGAIQFLQREGSAEVAAQADCVSTRPPPPSCQIRAVTTSTTRDPSSPTTTTGGSGGTGNPNPDEEPDPGSTTSTTSATTTTSTSTSTTAPVPRPAGVRLAATGQNWWFTWGLRARATVEDQFGDPYQGAVVLFRWSSAGGGTGTGSCTTDGNGVCTVDLPTSGGISWFTSSVVVEVTTVDGQPVSGVRQQVARP